MTVRVHNLFLDPDDEPDRLPLRVAERLGVSAERVKAWRVARRSVDPRGRGVRLVYAVDVDMEDEEESRALAAGAAAVDETLGVPPEIPVGEEPVRGGVIVVGCGPAGLLAALRLAENGYRPLVVERGPAIAERVRAVGEFLSGGKLDPEANILYGAGGAGAFSDGKLRTRTHGRRIPEVLKRLVEAGGPEDILYDARPHIGTDRLRAVLAALCRRIVACGGDIAWNTLVEEVEVADGEVAALKTTLGALETNAVVFATGPYARDSMAALLRAGAAVRPKPFQMGLRIEHDQAFIDRAVYGVRAGHPKLGAADYVLVARGESPVTSFCVCPGGTLLAATAEAETFCTNGMSVYRRDSGFCNGALVTTVMPKDFGASDALAGFALQRRYEEIAYTLGGGGYRAPAQTAADFLRGAVRPIARSTTYGLGVTPADLSQVVPGFVARAVGRALGVFDRRFPGFAGEDALMVGPEARASCPVRVGRSPETRECETVRGLYPAGAGSGYAAGIMSSAVDGLLSAEAVIRRFRPPA